MFCIECQTFLCYFPVLEELIRTMTDSEDYDGNTMVTVGHFLHHLHRPLQHTVPSTAQSLTVADLLLSGNPAK